jgi:hypothetical protein
VHGPHVIVLSCRYLRGGGGEGTVTPRHVCSLTVLSVQWLSPCLTSFYVSLLLLTCLIVHVTLWVDGAPQQGVQQVVLNIHLSRTRHTKQITTAIHMESTSLLEKSELKGISPCGQTDTRLITTPRQVCWALYCHHDVPLLPPLKLSRRPWVCCLQC